MYLYTFQSRSSGLDCWIFIDQGPEFLCLPPILQLNTETITSMIYHTFNFHMNSRMQMSPL